MSTALAPGCGAAEPPVGSIGAVLGKSGETGALYVREVPADDTLDEALLPGDRIVSVDGREVTPMSSTELRAVLRGPVGSKLRVTILRGDTVVRLELARVPLREAGPRPAREERLEE